MSSVRKYLLISATIAASLCTSVANAGERVEINKTHIVNLPQAAAAVIVGNPDIADVSVHSDRMLFLLGRSYGETDLLVLDSYGNTILNTDITVIASQNSNLVKVTNIGQGSASYNCAPKCLPSPQFEDNAVHKNEYTGGNVEQSSGAAFMSALTDMASDVAGSETSAPGSGDSEEFAQSARSNRR